MDLDVVFLGTSGSGPTAQRSPSATLLRRGGDRLLVDCAEGTQRQLMRSAIGLPELREVFLTHFHADHYLGLPGMLKTFSLRGRTEPLTIYGPRGLGRFFGEQAGLFGIGNLSYRYELRELEPGDELDRGDHRLVVFPVRHRVRAIGYALVERPRPGRFDVEAADALGVPPPRRGDLQRGSPVELDGGRIVTPSQVLGPPRAGRKVVLAGDTMPAESVLEMASGAELLVHEATFCEDERERARETWHSTAADAARLAHAAEVGMLALTHLSGRYSGGDVRREASEIFPNTVVPRDFDVIEVPYPERGPPQLVKGGALPAREAEAVSSSR
ncbi:MAG TPA: ribonuclease Z [Gaiellaceae bacterium]